MIRDWSYLLHEACFSSASNNFVNCAKWSPDGEGFVCCTHDGFLRFFWLSALTTETLRDADYVDVRKLAECKSALCSCKSLSPGQTVQGIAWHPHSDFDSQTAKLAFLLKDLPVSLWHWDKNEIVASYVTETSLGEFHRCYSITFDQTAKELYAGGRKRFFVFDVSRPGRPVQEVDVLTTTRAPHGIFGGIVSCVAPFTEGWHTLACGTYGGGDIGLYELRGPRRRSPPDVVLTDKGCSGGGVTQIVWASENVLVSGHRQDTKMRCWDIRYPDSCLFHLPRQTLNNQRFLFDVQNDVVVTGTQDGHILANSLHTGQLIGKYAAHVSACGTTALHPRLPLLLTGSGGRETSNDDGLPLNSVRIWYLDWRHLLCNA